MSTLRWLFLGAGCIALPGCWGASAPAPVESLVEFQSADPATPATPPAWTGRWVLRSSQEGQVAELALLEIREPGAGERVVLASESPLTPGLTLAAAEIKENTIEITFRANSANAHFVGTWHGPDVPGTISIPNLSVAPAQLAPATFADFKDRQVVRAIPNGEQYGAALGAMDNGEDLARFVAEHPRNPLALDAIMGQIATARAHGLDAAALQKLIAEYRTIAAGWGPALAPRVVFESLGALVEQNLAPEVGKELLADGREHLAADLPPIWRINWSIAAVSLGQADDAIAQLEPMYKKNPLEPAVGYTLARAYQFKERDEEALKLYAGLFMVPGREKWLGERLPWAARAPIGVQLGGLWHKLGRSNDDLRQFAVDAYREQLALMVSPRTPPTDAAAQPLLVELFTGANSEDCQGVEWATAQIDRNHTGLELVIVRYHEPDGSYDALANEQARVRGKYYDVRKAPSVQFDGVDQGDFAGGFAKFPECYRRIETAAREARERKPSLTLDLKTVRTGDELAIEVEARGQERWSEQLRLRIAIVEDEVDYPAANGVRLHDGVVRSMPGGVGGTAPVDGRLAFSGTVSLADLRTALERERADQEATYNRIAEEQKAPPLEKDFLTLNRLRVVAFVQNDKTRHVLQTAVVAVPVPAP